MNRFVYDKEVVMILTKLTVVRMIISYLTQLQTYQEI